MIITGDLVEAFLKCPTKCFLRSCGEAGTENAYSAWLQTKNNAFRIEGTKRLVAGVAPDKCAIGTQAMESPKPAQWHLGIDFAVQSQNLQCSCQAVEQIPSAGRGRTAQFVPIRFVFRNKLNRDDKLLLAFDARVLSEVLSREVGLGKIVYGENYATLKVKTLGSGKGCTQVDRQDWYAACQSLISRPGSEPPLCRVRVSKPLSTKGS